MKHPLLATPMQAVIFCGPGHRLTPMIDDEVFPKCKLPIANRPMLSYPMTFLHSSGIKEVFVVCPSSSGPSVQAFLDGRTASEGGGDLMRAELVLEDSIGMDLLSNSTLASASGSTSLTHSPSLDDMVSSGGYNGTVPALLSLKDRLRDDFLILPCDFITDLPLTAILESWKMKDDNTAIMCLLATPFAVNFSQQIKDDLSSSLSSGLSSITAAAAAASSTTASGSTHSSEPVHRLSDDSGLLVGIDQVGGERATFWLQKDDVEDERLTFSMAMLMRYPHLSLRTDLIDLHFYIIKRALLDDPRLVPQSMQSTFANATARRQGKGEPLLPPPCPPLHSLREDLIPRLVKRQFGSKDEYGFKIQIIDGLSAAHASSSTDSTKRHCFNAAKGSPLHTSYCLRANTLSTWAEVNKQVVRRLGQAGERLLSQAAEVGKKSQVGQTDSMVGDHSVIGEKSSIKRSVLGNMVRIGRSTKISNSIIMDSATIGDNCKLEGCIVGPHSIIKDSCTLKDCDVGHGHVVVEEGTVGKGEMFTGAEDVSGGGACGLDGAGGGEEYSDDGDDGILFA